MRENFTKLQSAILETLLYFDIFDYPLTLRQIFLLISISDVSVAQVRNCLENSPLTTFIIKKNEYYCIKGKEDTIRSINHRMSRGKQLLTMAEKTARIIRHLPFIRGIYISGDLSKGVSTIDSDIDFFIISAPARIYLSKLFLALFRRIPFLNPKKLLCFNYILDEGHLELDDKNHFVAMEIAYLGMLYNQDLFDKFLTANSWVTEFVPRYRSVCAGVNNLYLKKSRIQGIFELFFNNPVGKFLDRSLMYLWRYSWSVKYRKYDSVRNSFVNGTQRSFCKIHDSNRNVRILDEYNKRMHKMGLTRKVVIKTGSNRRLSYWSDKPYEE